jgi:hypothetical protein
MKRLVGYVILAMGLLLCLSALVALLQVPGQLDAWSRYNSAAKANLIVWGSILIMAALGAAGVFGGRRLIRSAGELQPTMPPEEWGRRPEIMASCRAALGGLPARQVGQYERASPFD